MLPLFGRPDAPALDSNFLSGIPAGYSFARASNASYFDAAGTLQTAANDTARQDYDPTGASPAGTLLEVASTNQVRNPRAEGASAPSTLPTNWGTYAAAGLTATVVGSGTEDGIPYCDIRWAGTTTGSATATVFFEPNTQIAALTGQTWTGSVFLRLVAGAFPKTPQINMAEYTSAGAFITGSSQARTPTSAPLATQRATLTRTLSGGATVAAVNSAWSCTAITTGTAVDFTLRVGLPQMEQQGYASSPILPPVGSPAAATRAADNLILPLPYAGFPGVTAWTAAMEFVTLFAPGGVAGLSLCASTGFNDITYGILGAAGRSSMVKRVASSSASATGQTGSANIGALSKWAIAQDTTDARVALNAGSIGVATNAGYPAMVTLGIGKSANGGLTTQPLRARRLRLWPRKLSDAELMAVTT